MGCSVTRGYPFSPLRIQVGWEPASPHPFQIFQSLLGIFLPKVSDWTISTNQRLERRCPEPSSAPERALPPAQSAPLLWGLVDGEGGKPRVFVGDSTWRRQWPWWRRRKRAEGGVRAPSSGPSS